MLNKIKIILWLIILLAVAYFVSMNIEPKISINVLPTYQTPEMPLAIIIILSMIIGAILILFFTITDWFSFKIEKLKLKRQLNIIKDKLEKCEKETNKLKEELNTEKKKQRINAQQEERKNGII